jgi:sugar lactone lactonase YvrE
MGTVAPVVASRPVSGEVMPATRPSPARVGVPVWTVVAGKAGGGAGERGSGAGEFSYPRGIAVDGNGAVWVAEGGNHRIQVREPDGRWRVAGGKAGGGDGASGSGAGEFWYPHGIAVDGNGAVWVAEWGNNRIQRYGVG